MNDQSVPRSERMSRPASRARSKNNVSGPPHSAHKAPFKADRFGGYSAASITLHWLVAIAVGGLIVTSAMQALATHVSVGLLLAPLLLFHAARRLVRGFPRAPDEPAWLALIGRLAMIALLIATLTLTLTGIALPAVDAGAYSLPGMTFPSPPWPGEPVWAARLGAMHAMAATVLFAALAIHLVLAVSYGLRGLTAVALRMRHPVDNGH